jgi:hypothetical protein
VAVPVSFRLRAVFLCLVTGGQGGAKLAGLGKNCPIARGGRQNLPGRGVVKGQLKCYFSVYYMKFLNCKIWPSSCIMVRGQNATGRQNVTGFSK